jgi:hypothetical protein
MSEQQFEDFLKRHAGDYNAAPHETPRDEMWAAIAKARAASPASQASEASEASRGGGSAAAPDIVSLDTRRPTRRYAPWIGMAATLLVGIGIGRFVMSSPTAPQVAQQPARPAATTATPSTDAPAAPIDVAAPSVADVTPARAGGNAVQLASRAPARRLPAATSATAENGSSPFALASREHLQRAEALVSVVASTPADALMDSLTGRWAREMLMNTRLLLDSPAGDDPARRRLLEDLETVLVQLVQRSGADAEERALVGRTLERTQLLTRLRNGAAGL